MNSQYPTWLSIFINIPSGTLILSEEMMEDIHRYVLSKTDKNGLVYDKDGYVDILGSNAALHLFFLVGKLKKRIIDRSSKILKQVIKHRLEAEGIRPDQKKQPLFSLTEFCALMMTINLFQAVNGRNLLNDCGYEPKKLVKQFLLLFRKPDGFFSEADLMGESSLVKTAMAVIILQSVGLKLSDYDRKFGPQLTELLEKLKLPRGGFCDRLSDPLGSVERTAAGIYLMKVLASENPPLIQDGPEIEEELQKTREFLSRLRTPFGGYRSDGLSPSPDLRHSALAVLAFGMLNGYQYSQIPEKERTLDYIRSLERRDIGLASDQWGETSDIESTFIGLIISLLLSGSSSSD